jgi:hypothetical protein
MVICMHKLFGWCMLCGVHFVILAVSRQQFAELSSRHCLVLCEQLLCNSVVSAAPFCLLHIVSAVQIDRPRYKYMMFML